MRLQRMIFENALQRGGIRVIVHTSALRPCAARRSAKLGGLLPPSGDLHLRVSACAVGSGASRQYDPEPMTSAAVRGRYAASVALSFPKGALCGPVGPPVRSRRISAVARGRMDLLPFALGAPLQNGNAVRIWHVSPR